MPTETTVMKVVNGEFTAKIVHVEPDALGETAVLWWTDGINEWREIYERLSLALMRLALLQYSAETGGGFFVGDEADFRTLYQMVITLGIESNNDQGVNNPEAAIDVLAAALLRIMRCDKRADQREMRSTREMYEEVLSPGGWD